MLLLIHMIASLRGKIIEIRDNSAIVEVGDVGYKVYYILREFGRFQKMKNQEVYLHTFYYLRENVAELYAFFEREEKRMFEILIGISGVGPKGALNILNAASVDILQRAIAQGDSSVLTKVSGIGNRIAQKIIVELKDKFGAEWGRLGGDILGESDVIEALQSLGYSRTQAQEALKKLPENLEKTEDKVKEALKMLGQG
ncbi:MAG: Holliday junction DNA helicase RuvA [Candidatus Spechtbacteria bacterium RIFCSPLOWO2_12_FULL_38_22]|uniref:Holliday junction branch migration complex subunit RuvA n=1 Tax=Candidatus Spechtbacteria bacterium RIFCSPLOWO2_12_FULL_38_22 TaxID=1802165 RepID=A0A1G2HHE3_9BACT|nr:MAG: Holliday junction DNA helicase RuvA [Candidatus Spechtbacteria bacterium RIFCSPLOWO2_12_FULL_38_22]